MKKILSGLLVLCMLCSAASAQASDIESILQNMTLREKIGQLFCVRPEAIMVSGSKVLGEKSREILAEYPVGGFVFFANNIESAPQVKQLMADLSSVTKIPPYFAVDEEGGSVARIANSSAYPNVPDVGSMGKIGKTGDSAKAREAGKTIGSYLKALGFHLDFAPVADVRSNSGNSVIGNRAFSSDPELAAEMVAAAVQGFREAGMACTLKHFPGHGHTNGDTHHGSAVTGKTWKEMLECEILPFEAGIAAGADAVMMAHILTPNAAGDGLPASLSPEMVSRLRNDLGFGGLIITDSLEMAAITKDYSSDEAAMAALYAGADVLLMPRELKTAFDMMVWAVEENILPMERVDTSVRRILHFKKNLGLI